VNVRGVEVILTAACNLRCAYCYQDRKQAARMSWETLKAAVDLLGRSSQPRVVLNFFGGEPLLEFDLIRQAVAYAERVIPTHVARQFGVCTNGTVLDGKKLEFLDSHGVDVQLSFDGVAEAQDERAPGTFAGVDALLDRMRREHGSLFRDRLSVAVTVTARNLRCLADSVDYLLAKGVCEIGISPVVTHEADWQRTTVHELDEQWERVYRSSLEHHRETGQTPVVALRRRAMPRSTGRTAGAICSAGNGQVLTVDVDGSVWPCVLFCGSYQSARPGLLEQHFARRAVGRVDAPGLATRLDELSCRVRETRLFHRLDRKHSAYGDCRECTHREGCAICPISIAHIPGNDDPMRVPDFQCAFQRVAAKWRARFPAQPSTADLLTGREAVPAGVERLMQTVLQDEETGADSAVTRKSSAR